MPYPLYPLRFQPIYQHYVWGGHRIAEQFHRTSSEKIAESWELSDRPDGMSLVLNGPLKGKSLHELLLEMKEQLVGLGQTVDRFPILLKIIDAKENLSVQVHPDEQTSRSLGGEPKTEMWFSLAQGSVYAGLSEGVQEQDLLEAIQQNRAEPLLQKVDLDREDAIYIPSGRVHAICAGCLVYEIQQNSNTTYRLYDWGRASRELHLKKGMASIKWEDQIPNKAVPIQLENDAHHRLIRLVSSPFFIVERLDLFGTLNIPSNPTSCQIFFCFEGEGTISAEGHTEEIQSGMTYLLPAACRSIALSGSYRALRITLPPVE